MNPSDLGRGRAFAEALEAVDGREVVVFPPTCYLDAVARSQQKCRLGRAGRVRLSGKRRVHRRGILTDAEEHAARRLRLVRPQRAAIALLGRRRRDPRQGPGRVGRGLRGDVVHRRDAAGGVGGHGRRLRVAARQSPRGRHGGGDGEHCGRVRAGLGHRHGAGLPGRRGAARPLVDPAATPGDLRFFRGRLVPHFRTAAR